MTKTRVRVFAGAGRAWIVGRGLAVGLLLLASAAHATGTTPPTPPATPTANVTMDELVDRTCGSNPLERKIAARLARASLPEHELVAVKKCTNWSFNGTLASPLPIKALKLLDVKAEAAFRKCLLDEKIREPKVVDALTSYVRDAFGGDEADRRMQRDYAGCYANVLRCRQNPCPTGRSQRAAAPASGPLRVSVRLLAADANANAARDDARRFLPLAADRALKTGDQVVFEVTTSRPAYVYIVQRAARGRLNVLFPDPLIPARNPLQPSTLRLPPKEHFVLDDEIGRETVFVVASLHEQVDLGARLEAARHRAARAADDGDREQTALGQALAKVSTPGSPPAGKRPPATDAVTRGLMLASRTSGGAGTTPSEGPTATAEAAPGDDTVVIELGFAHLPVAVK